jgi:hypothetical protein
VRSRGAQTTRHLGPGMFLFSLFRFFTNIYIYICVIRPTDPPSLQERVGGPYLRINRPTDPPSQQERRWAVSTCHQAHRPTLTTNASWWAIFTPTDPTLAPNASRWGLFPPIWPTQPTLATNASWWAIFTPTDPTLAPNASRSGLFPPIWPTRPTLAANASWWAVFMQEHTLYPTLSPNASWWGLILYFSRRRGPNARCLGHCSFFFFFNSFHSYTLCKF